MGSPVIAKTGPAPFVPSGIIPDFIPDARNKKGVNFEADQIVGGAKSKTRIYIEYYYAAMRRIFSGQWSLDGFDVWVAGQNVITTNRDIYGRAGEFEQPLVLLGAVTNPNHATTKAYVDAAVSAGAGVTSVFGRSGPAILAVLGDYSFALISGAATKAQLPVSVAYEDESNAFVGNQSIAGELDMLSNPIRNVAYPTVSDDAANQQFVLDQVQAAVNGLDPKASVRVATDAPLPATRLGNVLTATGNGSINDTGIDGLVDLAVSESVLVKDQGTGADNGIYEITDAGSPSTPFILTRRSDADSSPEVTFGLHTYVEDGISNAGFEFLLTTQDPITLNTTALTFSPYRNENLSFLAPLSRAGQNVSLNTVTVPFGGTGLTTLANGSLVIGSGGGTMVALPVGGAGTILVGGGATPAYTATPTIGGLATIASVLVGTPGSGVLFDDVANGQLVMTNAAGAMLTSILFGPANPGSLRVVMSGGIFEVLNGDLSDYFPLTAGSIQSVSQATSHRIILDQNENYVGGPTVVFVYGGTDEYYLSADNAVVGGRLNTSTSLFLLGSGAAIKGETATKLAARNGLDTEYIAFQSASLQVEGVASSVQELSYFNRDLGGSLSGLRRVALMGGELSHSGTANIEGLRVGFSDGGFTGSGYVRPFVLVGRGGTPPEIRFDWDGDLSFMFGAGITLNGSALTQIATGGTSRYLGRKTSAVPPSTSDFPTDGDWGFHYDTAADRLRFSFNFGGAIRFVQLA